MTSVVAAKTNKIRVGAGGIMLPNHSALSVMERFTVLESLFPERIDLATGRAPGTDPITSIALARTMDVHNKNPFTEQLDDLFHFFNRDFPSNHPYAPIKTPGNTDKIPEMFMLGSSQGGVQFALHKEMGFAFAHHINPGMANAALNYYKDNFKNSHPEKDLYSIISIAIITAETDEEAKRLSAPLELMWTKRMSGNAEFELIDPETASTYVYTPQEQIVREQVLTRIISGGIDKVEKKLREIANDTQVDQIMLVDYYPDRESKKTALRLLSDRFELDI